MPRVNRNDPCPCGSGKKYKNCCMRRDSFGTSRELSLGQAEAYLVQKLYEAAQSPRFARDLTNAYNLYWGGVYEVDAARQVPSDDMRRMLEWFVHDYPTGDDRKPLLEWFIETQTANYPPEALEVLKAWAASVSGIFRVLSIAGDGQLELYDCLRQGLLIPFLSLILIFTAFLSFLFPLFLCFHRQFLSFRYVFRQGPCTNIS